MLSIWTSIKELTLVMVIGFIVNAYLSLKLASCIFYTVQDKGSSKSLPFVLGWLILMLLWGGGGM